MKLFKNKFTLISLLLLISFMTACGSGQPASGSSSAAAVDTSKAATASDTGTQKTFTKDELAKFDGKNGSPAYVAIDGVVYDVSLIKQWMGGMHHGLTAGKDLSEEIKKSPHGKGVLKMLPVVGKYTG